MNRKETNNEIPLLIKLPFAEGDIRRDSEAVGRTEQTTLTSGAGGPLMGSQVIAMIRKAGGDVWLDQDSRVLTKGVSGKLLKRLQESLPRHAARKPAISESSRRAGISEDFELAGYVSHRSAIRVEHATEQTHERELMPVLKASWIRS